MLGLKPAEKQSLEALATKILEEVGYDSKTDTYVDAVKLVRSFGFIVKEPGTLSACEDAYIKVNKAGDKKVIAINDVRAIEYKRFFIAAIFSYYVLNYTGPGEKFERRWDKTASETEYAATYLASCLLVPPKNLPRMAAATQEKGWRGELLLRQLQQTYRVPIQMVKCRMPSP